MSGLAIGARKKLSWRLFPVWMGTAMLAVFAVNGLMVYYALTTFPGQAGNDGFTLSNSYEGLLTQAEQEGALGWNVAASADAGKPVIRISLPDGKTLNGGRLHGVAVRPLGPEQRTDLAFRQGPDGSFRADQTLLEAGAWDLMMVAEQGGHRLHVTRRVVLH